MNDNKIIDNGSIDLDLLRKILFSKRALRLTIYGIAVVFLSAYIYILTATEEYLITAQVAPVQSSGMSSGLSGINQITASLGLGTVGRSSSIEFEKFKKIIYAEETAQLFIDTNDPRAMIFGDRFDPVSGNVTKFTIKDRLKGFVYRLLGRKRELIIDKKTLSNYVESEISMSIDRQTDFITFSFMHQDKEVGLSFLSDLINIADKVIKIGEREKTNSSINYLKSQINSTKINEHRQALVNGLTYYEIQMSIIGDDSPYAASFIRKPTTTRQPVTPSISNTGLFAILFSLLLWPIISISDFLINNKEI